MRRFILALALFLTSLPLAAAITGSIINTDGQPVSGAKVTIYAPETPQARLARIESTTSERAVLASTTTNAKGLFSVDPPKAVVYLVEVEASGFAPEESEVVAGDDAGAIALTAAQTKTGKVTADGKAVANALVLWLGTGGVEVLAHTDDQGRYSVPDPAKWASRLVVRHPDYAMESKSFSLQDRITGADVTLTAGMALAGGVVAEDGQTPVAKATVTMFGFTVATTGTDGRFTIAHAPKRWESLTAVAGDRIGTITQTSKGTTIHLAKGSFVSGVLRDAKAQTPIVGAIVSAGVLRRGFANGEATGSALTDAKGSFAIGPLPPASYYLGVNRAGYVGLQTSVPLVAGQKVSKPMAAMQLARVSGAVLDENKSPVAGAVVAPQQVSRGNRGAMFMFRAAQTERTAYSGVDGRFSAFAPEGDVQVTAQKSGWPAGHSDTLRVVAGERKTNVTITVPRGIAVSGRVVDQNGKPVAGAAVASAEASAGGFGPGGMRRMIINRMRRGGGGDSSVQTGNDGTFTVRLKEGTYDFVVSHEGFSHAALNAQHVTASMKPLEIKLEPSVEITGRVVRSGVGVAGATVGTASTGGDFASDMTQGDGSFRLADLSPGQMMLFVSKSDEFVQTVKPVTAPAKDLVIELPAGSTVSGRVIDKSAGKPITSFEAGVTVPRGGGGMMVMLTPPMMQAFNSDDGSFTLENVPTGQVQITASAPGYETARVSTTVAEGKPVTGVEIALDSGVKLSGRVTGPDGSPLAGVAVTAMPAGRVMRMGPPETTTTDGNGEYSMDALDPGDHSFAFSWSTLPPVSKSVNLSGKETRLDVQLSAGVHINGIVVSDSGAPVADAQVRASSAVEGAMNNATQTDASGSFMFDGLMPGHYTFTATKPGYGQGILRDFDISGGAPVRLTMAGGGTIFGHVAGVTGSDLAQTTVSASSTTGNASTAVDSGGNYRIEGAPTGTVRVQASVQQGFAGGRNAPPQTVNVDPGGSVQVDLQFQSSTVITGRVTSAGMPLDSAMIAFFPRDGNAQTNARTTTGSDGTYSVTGLDDALYGVSINDINRGISYSTQYQVKGSGTFDVDMKVMTVRGHVLDASTGQGINNAVVEVRSTGTGVGLGMRAQPTDSNGYYQFDSIAPGSYQASAAKDGYGNSLQSISVSDSAVDQDFKLTPQAGVTLTVVDARDHQQLAANVRVYDSSGADVYDSPFRFSGAGPISLPIAAGTYRAVVSAQGYATETITITSPSQPTVALTPGGTIVIHRTSGPAARLRILNPDGTPYTRGGSLTGTFNVVAAPLTTTIPFIASGTYTLQLLDQAGAVTTTQTVTVADGATVDVQM